MPTMTKLSNIQQELLKMYSTDIDDKELEEVKDILGKYFANKATEKANKFWDKNKLSNDDMRKWLDEK
ncbi:MAG: hypothetical protein MJB14_09590 [Spirochaetes bacterium]|nr:hypothetical protein [Spirochaetota bacterium]